MDDPPVNRNVFAVIFAISILHLVFSFVFLIIYRANTLGEFPFSLTGDGATILSFLGQVLLFGVLVSTGLHLGKSVGLGAPLLESWAKGEPVRQQALSALTISVAIGLGVAAAKYLLDLLVFSPFLPATLSQWREVPFMFRLPIPFQQGIGDEIVYRLFLMTVIVWIIWKIRGSGDEPLRDTVFWAGILVAGLVSVLSPTLWGLPVLVALQYAVIILAGAIPFGWLYWKKGIGAALVAHFTSSVLLVLFTLG